MSYNNNRTEDAQLVYEVNRQYKAIIGEDPGPLWEDALPEIRMSVRDGMKKLALNPEESHKAWVKYKEAEGWVYGRVRNDNEKIHPCMVPYDKLPIEQRMKDYLFLSVSRALASLAGSSR